MTLELSSQAATKEKIRKINNNYNYNYKYNNCFVEFSAVSEAIFGT